MNGTNAAVPAIVDGVAADLELMRAAALLESDPEAVVRRATAILAASPQHESAKLLLATACRRLGDPATAADLLESLARALPNSPTLQLELGRALAAANHHAGAIAALERAISLDARLADAWRELAAQRHIAGDNLRGDRAYARYNQLVPASQALADAARALSDNRLDAAEVSLKQRLQRAPEDVAALRLLAFVARAHNKYFEAEHYLTQCLQYAPGYAAARLELASELCTQLRFEEAAPHVQRLLDAEPHITPYICLQLQVLRFFGRYADASALVQQAIAENPDDATLRLYYGHQLRESGEYSGAIEAYRRALALQPGMWEAYRSLADMKTVRFTDADREAMQQLARRDRTGAVRTQIEFVIGKTCEDAGEYAQAFEHYARGNAEFRATIFHTPDAISAGVRRSQALYSTHFFAERLNWGSERADPIFIVGMPRSGSTLLEQILASHSQVEGTRELPYVPAIARDVLLSKNPHGKANYPDPVGALSSAEVAAYAARYLQQTQRHRLLGKPHFVDKMLVNFDHVGLIHLMFPRANIIDARRHPLACCFSCFKQFFDRGHPFSYDQEEMARHYRDYHELMEHIDSVLPGRVYRVHYEQLVADPEATVRRLLDHCGLRFEEGCLRFYENRRVVTTISSEQVRRPINSDAVDQWRHFEPWLGKLKQTLGDLIDRYPTFTPRQF